MFVVKIVTMSARHKHMNRNEPAIDKMMVMDNGVVVPVICERRLRRVACEGI